MEGAEAEEDSSGDAVARSMEEGVTTRLEGVEWDASIVFQQGPSVDTVFSAEKRVTTALSAPRWKVETKKTGQGVRVEADDDP